MVVERIEDEWEALQHQDAWIELVESLLEDRDQISYRELVALLPESEEDTDLLEALLEALAERGIEVLDEPAAEPGAEGQAWGALVGTELDQIPADDLLSIYLAEQSREPLLSHDEEIELARQIELGRLAERSLLETDYTAEQAARMYEQIEVGQAARERLARANTRLVISIAKRYRNLGIPFNDLIQEGNVGLMRAVDRYDPESGNRFSTYATWWIRQAVTRSLANKGRIIRIPVHTGTRMREMNLVAQRLEQELGDKPTAEEIAVEMGEAPGKIRQMLRWGKRPVSLEQPFGDEEDAELGDFVEDEDVAYPEEITDSRLLEEALTSLMGVLNTRELRILRLRYGLGDTQTFTLSEVAAKLGLSRERIRQIERAALAKLRLAARHDRLEDFIT
jgi:RNA polymerase primary sigma factor